MKTDDKKFPASGQESDAAADTSLVKAVRKIQLVETREQTSASDGGTTGRSDNNDCSETVIV